MLIAIEDFKSITGKDFKKGDVVPQGDATSMGKYLKQANELSDIWDKEEAEIAPEENKVMTKKDLKTKTKKSKQ